MAGWLYRNLKERVDEFIVSEPRRNKLITSDGDKDDKIDASKLAALLRGKFLKPVHHTDDINLVLKQVYSVYYLEAGRRFFRRSRSLSAGVGLVILFRNFALS